MGRLLGLISRQGIKAAVLVAALALLLCSAAGGTLAYIVTKTPTFENTFVGGLEPVGSIKVSKAVEHPFGEGYQVPDNENTTFSFTVDLGTGNAGKSFGTYTADDAGVIILDVKAQSAVVIPDIPAGTQAVVSEAQDQGHAGFSVKDGRYSQTLTIAEGETASAAFVNVYAPAPAQLNLAVVGSKELVGCDWQEGDSFTYCFERLVDGEWVPLGEQTIVCRLVEQPDPDNPGQTILVPDPNSISFDFTELMQDQQFSTVGTHSFRVTQTKTNVGGLTHESTEERFDVRVGDADMDGKLEVQGMSAVTSNTKIDEENSKAIMLFRSTYAPEGTSSVSIDIAKRLDDASGQGKDASGFAFELRDEDGKVVQTSELTDALGYTSLTLTFGADDAGKTFAYALREKNDGASGVVYDASVYAVEVQVEDKLDGTISALVSVDGGKPADSCTVSFANAYDPADARLAIAGSKVLSGCVLEAGEFQFNLYQTTREFEVPEDVRPLLVASNDAEGAFSFDVLSFDKVGTYYYVVAEDASEPIAGVEYDHNAYAVTVTVADEGGRLVAHQAVRSMGDGETSAIAFSNVYKAEPVGPDKPDVPDEPDKPDSPDDPPDDPDGPDNPPDVGPGGQNELPDTGGGDGASTTGTSAKGDMAQTGDNVNVLPVVALVVIAAAVVVVAAVALRLNSRKGMHNNKRM